MPEEHRPDDHATRRAYKRHWVSREVYAEESNLSSEDLLDYAAGTLGASDRKRIEALLSEHPHLREALHTVRAELESSATEPDASSSASLEFGPIRPPLRRRLRPLLTVAAALLAIYVPLRFQGKSAGIQDMTTAAEPQESFHANAFGDGTWGTTWGPDRGTLGSSRGFEVLSPQGLVGGLRPEIVWSSPRTEQLMSVRVQRDDGTDLFIREVRGERLEWPKDAPNLEPGDQYLVLVDAIRGPQASVKTWFTVVDSPTANRLRRRIAASKTVLERAQVLACAGLRSDASSELEPWVRSLPRSAQNELLTHLGEKAAGDIVRDVTLRLGLMEL